jgi:WD40 repeat protein
LAISNNGKLLATGQKGNNADIFVWEYATGRIVFKLSEHDHEVSNISFSHDDR